MARQRTAIIVGAGVVGVATAYALARRGWQTTVVEKDTGPGMGASRSNGAQLSYCYTDALASPGILNNLPATLMGKDGLRLSWSASPSFAFWLVRFLRNCTAGKFKQNTLAVLDLARASRDAMAKLLATHPIDFGQRVSGKLHLYHSHSGLKCARSAMVLKRTAGCEQQELSVQEAVEVEPMLAQLADTIVGAIYTPCEEVADANAFCRALLKVLEEVYGTVSMFGQTVNNIGSADGSMATVRFAGGQELHADLVVLCAALKTTSLAGEGAKQIPIIPMKGYSFEMPLTDGSPSVSLTDTKRRIVIANLGDRMRVAGLADLGNWDASVDPQVSRQLVSLARAAFPGAGQFDQADNHWAGLRPMTANSQPIITKVGSSLAINAGHGMLGWTLAMGSGERLAESVS